MKDYQLREKLKSRMNELFGVKILDAQLCDNINDERDGDDIPDDFALMISLPILAHIRDTKNPDSTDIQCLAATLGIICGIELKRLLHEKRSS